MKKPSVLVTGGAGFIGSHLVKKLIQKFDNVIVVDKEIMPFSFFKQESLDKKTRFELLDIRFKSKVKHFLLKYRPDYIIHLAAQAIVSQAYDRPFETLNTNIMGTVNILDTVRECLPEIKGIIVSSSDKAYGKTKNTYTETSELRGDHPYDVSKSSKDLISYMYFKTYGLPVVITRFGNVFGEGDLHFNRIIPGICEAIIFNKNLEIRSNGKYIRDYIYVKDVVDGYLLLLSKINKVLGQAFNFSSNDTLSVVNVVMKAENILNINIPFTVLNTAKNEIPYQHLDDEKIRSFGWKNKYGIETTIKKILTWYRDYFRLIN